jgi:hypothetical protein
MIQRVDGDAIANDGLGETYVLWGGGARALLFLYALVLS